MKLIASIIKSLKENLRDWKILILVFAFAPFLIFLMYLFYGGESTTYKVGVLNLDHNSLSIELCNNLESVKGQDDTRLLKLFPISNQKELESKVKDKSLDIGILIPENYSMNLSAASTIEGTPVVSFYGSMGNMRYSVAAILSSNVIYNLGLKVQKINLPQYFNETFLEKKQPLNEFEGYVPSLLSLAILMILFTATATIVKENDKRTILRLRLSPLGSFNFLGGISLVQVIITIPALILSYITALGLGYHPVGGFIPVLTVGIISCFSMVAVSLVVACFMNTVFDVLTIGCFPFFIMMFFSGSMLPLPKKNLFHLGEHSFGITDILPLTHTAVAFNKILNYGAGITDVLFEISMIMVLTIFYFLIGFLLYQKKRLSKA